MRRSRRTPPPRGRRSSVPSAPGGSSSRTGPAATRWGRASRPRCRAGRWASEARPRCPPVGPSWPRASPKQRRWSSSAMGSPSPPPRATSCARRSPDRAPTASRPAGAAGPGSSATPSSWSGSSLRRGCPRSGPRRAGATIAGMLDQVREFLGSLDIGLPTIVDIGLTALLIYWFFVLIRGTRALRLVFGLIILYFVYVAAQFLGLQLLSQILQTGAVIGLLAIVVIFQPELRRALDRIGRMGTLRWLAPTPAGVVEHIATEIANASGALGAAGHGALIVIERHTPLGDIAETGVPLNADLSADLLRTIFQPKSEL